MKRTGGRPPVENIRLLLVDDEDNFRETLAKRLQKRGVTPQQAADGLACLSLLADHSIDVVVLDVKMPGLSGIEVLQHIKDKYPRTEVILLTGHASTPDGVEGIKSGAFDYLAKPIELEHLLSKIKQAYEKIQRAAQAQKEAEYRAKMEQQMIATERLASLGTLATGVAHEINNPLAIITESAGWLKLLLQKKELENMPRKADFAKALDKIDGAVERARRITHQLLGVVKQPDSAGAQINLGELAEEAVQLVHREAANKGIEIQQEIERSRSNVWSDPYQLRQVLLNLLTNAIHATDAGGRITLELEDRGEQIVLRVQDTGKGISKENLERVFDPFFSTKPPGEGTGLGLFVTRGIVQKLGGEIEVKSQIGRGTRFDIKLPKHREIKAELDERATASWIEKIKSRLREKSKGEEAP
ncbi:MAG: response regulator [Desulfobacterales bacterium]|nr:MAG: response regulator [Desulfobacterales bacterium]